MHHQLRRMNLYYQHKPNCTGLHGYVHLQSCCCLSALGLGLGLSVLVLFQSLPFSLSVSVTVFPVIPTFVPNSVIVLVIIIVRYSQVKIFTSKGAQVYKLLRTLFSSYTYSIFYPSIFYSCFHSSSFLTNFQFQFQLTARAHFPVFVLCVF